MRSVILVEIAVVAACGGGAKTPISPTGSGTSTSAPSAPSGKPPGTAKKVVTDTYHGVAIDDPYRWLEDNSPEVTAWSTAENDYARTYLDAIPGRAQLRAEIKTIVEAPSTQYHDVVAMGGKLFAMRHDPKAEQPQLIVADGPDALDRSKVVLDPAATFDAHHAIDWFVPSPDGTRVAVSISQGGSEDGTLYILDLDGKELDKPIPDVQRGTGGGAAAWRPDGNMIYYTRYPAKGERPDGDTLFWSTLWSHELGGARDKDKKELGDLPKLAEIGLATDAKGRVLATVQDGDSSKFRHYLRDVKGTWRQITDFKDDITFAGFGPTNDLWLVSHKDAPRGKVVRLPSTSTNLANAKVIIAESDAIVTDFYSGSGPLVTQDMVLVNYNVGGPSEVRAFDLTGKSIGKLALPPVAGAGFPVAWGKGAILPVATFTQPLAWYRYTRGPSTSATLDKLPQMAESSPVDLSGYEVRRETATSADGTKVPISIVWKKGAPLDGSVPCLVTGYGGFNISQPPTFLERTSVLMKHGMCYVLANLRGGAELGDDWHHAAMLTGKQHVFDDFAATLKFLVDNKYSSPAHLAIRGGSNGGLLMGALVTQHPELVRAVVSHVGIYDMLRNELTTNGKFNVVEFGSVTVKEQFDAMRAYSPYHRVVPGTRYPSILMTTGANDPRVAPWHSRKMIAALQAANGGDHPILLRTSATMGHSQGASTSDRLELATDEFAFILDQLGLLR